MNNCVQGFNSERLDPISNATHLGNGYRAYNPVLMRFDCPDGWSPFDDGGINLYAYSLGDPINRADPSGHFSLGQWIGMGVGLMAGIALSIATDGAAMPALLSVMATVAGDVAIGVTAELVTEAVDDKVITWSRVGIAAGLSATTTLAGFGLGIASNLKGTSNRLLGGLMMSGDKAVASAEHLRPNTLFTTYGNMQLARDIPTNYGFGNCEFVAKRAFKTLLSGTSYSRSQNLLNAAVESFYGIRNAIDNIYPFRQIIHPVAMYENIMRETSYFMGPLPEISTMTFSSKSAMERAINKAPPFSVFWATTEVNYMGGGTGHAFVIARGECDNEYYLFDKYSDFYHKLSTYHMPDYFFESISDRFEIEMTGFYN